MPDKSQNLSEEKKPHPEHETSVTFVRKVGTKIEFLLFELLFKTYNISIMNNKLK